MLFEKGIEWAGFRWNRGAMTPAELRKSKLSLGVPRQLFNKNLLAPDYKRLQKEETKGQSRSNAGTRGVNASTPAIVWLLPLPVLLIEFSRNFRQICLVKAVQIASAEPGRSMSGNSAATT